VPAQRENGDGAPGGFSPPAPAGALGAARTMVAAPAASPEEAAAVVAALERFMRETAPPSVLAEAKAPDPWWRAGILEHVAGAAQLELREPWIGA
jgi:hypothetical protein